MSNLSRLMHAARAVNADNQGQPLFERTQWIFIEIGELSEKINTATKNLTVARTGTDKAATMQLYSEIAQYASEVHMLCAAADAEFQKG